MPLLLTFNNTFVEFNELWTLVVVNDSLLLCNIATKVDFRYVASFSSILCIAVYILFENSFLQTLGRLQQAAA